jgi:excisionase family DNA binding protein
MTHTHSPNPTQHNSFIGRPINGSLLLTVSEAAAALRISRSSIYRLFDAGELAWVQIGASRRVNSAEIHRFIVAHTGGALTPRGHA